MLFKWLQHEEFQDHEKLMCVLFDLGIATKDQLMAITGWKEPKVRKTLAKIRTLESRNDKEIKEQWLTTCDLKDVIKGRKPQAYLLGTKGARYVIEKTGYDAVAKESSTAQLHHFLGMNRIIIRLLEAGLPPRVLEWESTVETLGILLSTWEQTLPNVEQGFLRRLSRPDARLTVGPHTYWIEFDNATENARKLEKKYQRYVNSIYPYKDAHAKIRGTELNKPVVWVTTSEKRKVFMKKIWTNLKETVYSSFPKQLPEMVFLVEGEETNVLIKRYKKHLQDQKEKEQKTHAEPPTI